MCVCVRSPVRIAPARRPVRSFKPNFAVPVPKSAKPKNPSGYGVGPGFEKALSH